MVDFYDTFSALTEEDKLDQIKTYREEAWFANLSWLEDAELAYKFKAGDQWSDDEKFKLDLQNREGLVWNYIHPAIELVCGVMAQNPTRIYPYPVEPSDAFLCQVLEDLVTHVDNTQLTHEEDISSLFENGVITGIGDIVVDVGPDPSSPEELVFYQSVLDAYEVLVDPMCKKSDLSDARYVIYEKWLTQEDFHVRYPGHVKDIEEIFTLGSSTIGTRLTHGNTKITGNRYNIPEYTSFEYYDAQNKRILVTHFEYREAYKRYYFIDEQGVSTEIDKKEVANAKLHPGKIVEIYDTKVYWVHCIHDRILWEGESPVYKKNFSLCRYSVYTDKSKRKHSKYGIVKPIIDPQKECNRRWLHTIKLLTRQGVGVMAEVDAFHDLRQAQDSWSDPDAITFMARGGLTKVKEKAVPVFPDAPMRLEEANKEAMKNISGINPDLMGVAQQRREPGINLKLRQQQGMTMLSKTFNNFKSTLKEIYKRKLEIIVRFMPDTQIQRILGSSEKYSFMNGVIIDNATKLEAPIRNVRDLAYNVRMEDAPGGMNKMMLELSIFLDMLEKKFPVDPNTIIDKLDLSPIEKINWKTFIQNQQQGQQQQAQAELQAKQAELQFKQRESEGKLALENAKLQTLTSTQQQQLQATMENNYNTVNQRDIASQRDFSAKIAAMDAAEKKDMLSILTWVAEQSTKINKDAAK
jgi:hypothetical protein